MIDLPDGKHLIIDSKLSLISWVKVSEATDEHDQELALAELIASTAITSKDYRRNPMNNYGIQTVDFVLCFIPLNLPLPRWSMPTPICTAMPWNGM